MRCVILLCPCVCLGSRPAHQDWNTLRSLSDMGCMSLLHFACGCTIFLAETGHVYGLFSCGILSKSGKRLALDKTCKE